MTEQKLRRNQLVMLLQKRANVSDSALYEMMQSRQVYHVQMELRKQLDRTIKAIDRAQKLSEATFGTQRAVFLKQVHIREKKHLILQSTINTRRPADCQRSVAADLLMSLTE